MIFHTFGIIPGNIEGVYFDVQQNGWILEQIRAGSVIDWKLGDFYNAQNYLAFISGRQGYENCEETPGNILIQRQNYENYKEILENNLIPVAEVLNGNDSIFEDDNESPIHAAQRNSGLTHWFWKVQTVNLT